MTQILRISTSTLFALLIMGVASSADGKQNSGPSKQWYVKSTISVANNETGTVHEGVNPAVIGKLKVSEDGYDKHDVKSYTSLVRSKAAVAFVQDSWGDRSGQYLSDYRSSKGSTNTWVMTVFSTVTDGQVTISWDGLFDLEPVDSSGRIRYEETRLTDSPTLQDLKLIDLETLEVIDAVANGQLNSYTFNINSEGSRNFRWVLGPIKPKYFEAEDNVKDFVREARWTAKQEEITQKNAEKKQDRFGPIPDGN